ncbi:hypothetical protein Tco_0347229 [Tanacetum coccineum]
MDSIVVKEDPTLNKKVLEVAEAYTKNSTNLTNLFTLVNTFDFRGLRTTVDSLNVVAHLDKEEKLEKAARDARLLEMNKFELIKVVHEEATKVGVDLKIISSEKIRKARELKMKIVDQYGWTTSGRLKPETIIDIHIYPNTKPVVITVYIGNDRRNFDVHNPFKFGDFGVTELDELSPIIQKKKNKVVGDLMTSLGKRYDRLKVIPKELGISSSFPALGQVLFITPGKKMKH